MLDNNAAVDVADSVTDKTALIKASYVGYVEVGAVLLAAGAPAGRECAGRAQ